MKKKNEELIENLGDIEKLTVQKSKPLFALWQSELTLAEFKILDTYLGRINSHDDEHRTVKFEKGELEELLGVKQLKPHVLDERLKHLMTTVRIPDSDNKKGFTRVSLFEKAHVEQDDYGVWEAEITCTETAKQYIFNVEEIQYLRYKLRNIINIKSRYTYIMFLYVWENKYRGTWDVSVEDLKILLRCDNEPTYKEFKRFNDLVLKKAKKEMDEVTDIRFDYETIKRGRSVVGIRFTYKPKEVLDEVDRNQISVDEWLAEKDNPKELWEQALEETEMEFSQEQIEELRSVLECVSVHKMPKDDVSPYSTEISRYNYMKIKCTMTKNRAKNKFPYLLKLLKTDAEIE